MDTMTDDAAPLSEATAPWMDRLRERGLEPDLTLKPGDTDPDDEDPADAELRHRQKLEHLSARWLSAIPPMYRGASLDDLDDDQHAIRARGWLRSGSRHLVLAGPVGTGKTHAAYAIGHQALASGMWVEAWNVGDLMDALRPGSDDRAADRRARDAQLLILDDLTAKASEWEAERLTLLMDARVRAERLTIITTNITSQQITDTWGARFMDRLRYRMTALTLTGESRRKADW